MKRCLVKTGTCESQAWQMLSTASQDSCAFPDTIPCYIWTATKIRGHGKGHDSGSIALYHKVDGVERSRHQSRCRVALAPSLTFRYGSWSKRDIKHGDTEVNRRNDIRSGIFTSD